MSVLWTAFGLYIVGVALVLYLRPESMFQENGKWKEFGIGSTLRTIFPFWLFTLVWAALSYSLATVGVLFVGQLARRPALPTKDLSASAAAAAVDVTPISKALPAAAAPVAAAAQPVGAFTTPGYYVLQTPSLSSDVPRYVYYGTTPPSAMDVARLSM
jgi:hypothetical protein